MDKPFGLPDLILRVTDFKKYEWIISCRLIQIPQLSKHKDRPDVIIFPYPQLINCLDGRSSHSIAR